MSHNRLPLSHKLGRGKALRKACSPQSKMSPYQDDCGQSGQLPKDISFQQVPSLDSRYSAPLTKDSCGSPRHQRINARTAENEVLTFLPPGKNNNPERQTLSKHESGDIKQMKIKLEEQAEKARKQLQVMTDNLAQRQREKALILSKASSKTSDATNSSQDPQLPNNPQTPRVPKVPKTAHRQVSKVPKVVNLGKQKEEHQWSVLLSSTFE